MSDKRIDESELGPSLAALLSTLQAEEDVIVERDSTPIAILKSVSIPSHPPASFDLDAGGGEETVVLGGIPGAAPRKSNTQKKQP